MAWSRHCECGIPRALEQGPEGLNVNEEDVRFLQY